MPSKKVVINSKLVKEINSMLDAGLTRGMNDGEFCEGEKLSKEDAKGKVCVEAAICAVLGQRHGDRPRCVNHDLAGFKIMINDDGEFTSCHARGRALKKLAIAQLGTKGKKFKYSTFLNKLAIKLKLDLSPQLDLDTDDLIEWEVQNYLATPSSTRGVIKKAVEVLKEMKTPGSRFLHLVK